MITFKYVIIDLIKVHLFLDPVSHKDLEKQGGNITSAAFVRFPDGRTPEVFGRSVSLKMGPGKDDAETIKTFMEITREGR